MKNFKNNNKGFSLVELIVVIAIMVVLVAVLAPVFTKYVEQSRRATDCSNASTIAEAVLVGVADGETTIQKNSATEFTSTTCSTVKSAPKVAGDKVSAAKGKGFFYLYNSSDNTVYVYVDNTVSSTNTLTTEAGAAAYKSTTPTTP